MLAAYVLVPEHLLRHWWVDDSAITFSYARNWANGDGLVPFAGGERVEGYSDPLWMAMLALGWLLHLDPFPLSKVLGGLLAAATVPVAWAVARWLPLPERDSRLTRSVPLLVAALVATNAQAGIWATAGLENSLFDLLIAVGAWRVLVESERGGMPWAALAFAGAALTHSEGVMYGAFAFLLAAWSDVRKGRKLRVVGWAVLFGAPYAIYQAARLWYFALPYPLPYYAKVVDTKFDPLRWTSRSWTYMANYGKHLGWGLWLPVLLVGVTRLRDWRAALVVSWFTATGALLLVHGSRDVDLARVALFTAMGILLPLLAMRRGEGPARLLFAGFAVMAVAFTVATNGDWMTGFRRYAVLALPLAVLLLLGAMEMAARIRRPRLAVGLVLTLVTVPVAWNIGYAVHYARHPTGMTPMTTRSRTRAFNAMARTLHIDRPWVAVDHAMGGMTWFAPPTGRVIDWYGLTDATFALHRPVHGFAADYLLRPPIFDMAHIEKGFRRTQLFQNLFVLVPPVPGRNKDNFVRRDLLADPAWSGQPTRVTFAGGHALEGYTVRSPEVHAGGGLYIELGLRRDEAHKGGFGVKVILDGPTTVILDASPGYDGMFPPRSWNPEEVFHGRYALALPDDLPEGRYTLGLALVSLKGEVEAASDAPPGVRIVAAKDPEGTAETPAVGAGEIRLPTTIAVVSAQAARAAGDTDWASAQQAAADGRCEDAEQDWKDALAHDPLNSRWRRTLQQRAQGPLADCWAARATHDSDLDSVVADLGRARNWDVRSPAANAVGRTFADAHWDQAMAARKAGKHQLALRLFEAIVHADPTRSWARRYAEEARTVLLARPAAPQSMGRGPRGTAKKKAARDKAKPVGDDDAPGAPPSVEQAGDTQGTDDSG